MLLSLNIQIMQRPKTILKFDQKLERELAWSFYNCPEFGGCNFWVERALQHHPELAEIESACDPKGFLDEYVHQYYSLHSAEIQNLGERTEEYLRQEEDGFFSIVNEIFRGHPWPKEEFIGDFSIFDFCPHFLKDGEFQIFIYDPRNLQLFTIFHEMLHLMFYDFVRHNFPETLGKMDTEEGQLWDLAEVFNIVIQETDDFIRLHGKIKGMGYPDHKGLMAEGRRLWKKHPDVQRWIVEMMRPQTLLTDA